MIFILALWNRICINMWLNGNKVYIDTALAGENVGEGIYKVF